ncbi:MAG: L,D-transpeptidase [Negativicutes bacterium]|nr:L,D-transpeptidase [Negativicutes bacterium]
MRIVLCLLLICFNLLTIAAASPEIRINIPEYLLIVVDKGQAIKKYDIAVGTPYEQTPTGNFTIFAKIENPTWYPGAKFTDRTPVPSGPDNPLGTRWMEFSPTYGIHGTNSDWSLGYAVSGGCIRMHDADARELYQMIGIGTPVTVVYETLCIREKPDGLYLEVLPDLYGRKTSSQETFQRLYSPFEAAGFSLIRLPAFPLPDADQTYEIKIANRRPPPSARPAAKSPQP